MRLHGISAAKITTRLRCCSAFGAPCFEARYLLAVETLRLASMPTFNQMRCASPCPRPVAAHHDLFKYSTIGIGIVASPGMTTGVTLGGIAALKMESARPRQMRYLILSSSASWLIHATDRNNSHGQEVQDVSTWCMRLCPCSSCSCQLKRHGYAIFSLALLRVYFRDECNVGLKYSIVDSTR
jgi:hypothetical protein